MLPLLFDRMRALDHGDLVDRLVRELEIPQPSDGPVRELTVSLDVHRAICDRAALELGDPFLGLHVAVEGPRGSYGIIEYAARAAPTVREALARAEKYVTLLSEVIELSVQLDGEDAASVSHRVDAHQGAGRHGNEYAMATFVRFGRELTGERLAPDTVLFMHEAPADTSELVNYFDTEDLRFGQADNRIVFGASVLALPIPAQDGALLKLLDRHAEDALPARATEPVPGLRRVLEGLLGHGPSLEAVAATLRTSPRTLQRRLQDAGTSFHGELDRVREDKAVRLLQGADISIYAVAIELGYADQGAFERAFRRWRSMSPKQFRLSSSRKNT